MMVRETANLAIGSGAYGELSPPGPSCKEVLPPKSFLESESPVVDMSRKSS